MTPYEPVVRLKTVGRETEKLFPGTIYATRIYFIKKPNDYELLGETVDDAVVHRIRCDAVSPISSPVEDMALYPVCCTRQMQVPSPETTQAMHGMRAAVLQVDLPV